MGILSVSQEFCLFVIDSAGRISGPQSSNSKKAVVASAILDLIDGGYIALLENFHAVLAKSWDGALPQAQFAYSALTSLLKSPRHLRGLAPMLDSTSCPADKLSVDICKTLMHHGCAVEAPGIKLFGETPRRYPKPEAQNRAIHRLRDSILGNVTEPQVFSLSALLEYCQIFQECFTSSELEGAYARLREGGMPFAIPLVLVGDARAIEICEDYWQG
ncbi:MAG: hypothetical protein LBC41_08810 [Clostridiales bacterium]|jgi:hypothetical protein|nr:hypothetical protein [Clostridiales bacterium]MDR2750746.1 hypothetical protein [Clostridiales bacterium]